MLSHPRGLVLWAILLIALPAWAWSRGDVEAAEQYRALERERAERFREQAEEGTARSAPIRERRRAEVTPRTRSQTSERRREARSQRRDAWQEQADRLADQVGRWTERLGEDLGEAIEGAIREAFEGRDRR